MKTIITLCLFFFLTLPAYGQDVIVEEIRSPSGGFYRQGYWQPVEVLLSSGAQGAEGDLELTAGKITFVTTFDFPPQARRRLSLQVVFFESDPSVSISVLARSAAGERFSFPSLANEFQKSLTCVAPDKQLVALIGDYPDESISYLFKKEEIVTVQLACARVPAESLNLSQFDAVVLGTDEWFSLSTSQRDAIEEFVRNGGIVFVPRRPLFPLPVTDKVAERRGFLIGNRWGLGKVVSPAAELGYEKSLRAKDPQLKEDLLQMLGLSKERLHPNPLLAPGVAEIFEPVPPFEDFRTNWFLILCIYISAALLGVGCCAFGIWKARYGLSLFFLSVAISSASFVFTFPEEVVNVRRSRIFLTHSGARQARVAEIVSITSESSPAVRRVDRVHLGTSGLLRPLYHNWSDYFRNEVVVEQPAPTALRLTVSPLTELLFQIDSHRRISGAVHFSSDSAGEAAKVANHTGFELNDCLFIQRGGAFSLGNIPPGKEVETHPLGDKGLPLTELIASMKSSQDGKNRSRGSILSYAFRSLCNPQTTYLVGWREDSSSQSTPAKNEQELWIIAYQ